MKKKYFSIALLIALLLLATYLLTQQSKKELKGVIDIDTFCDEEVKYEIKDACFTDENTIKLFVANYADRAIDTFFMKIYRNEQNITSAKISGVNPLSESVKELTDVTNANEIKYISLLPSITVTNSNYLCINKEKAFGKKEGPTIKRCE